VPVPLAGCHRNLKSNCSVTSHWRLQPTATQNLMKEVTSSSTSRKPLFCRKQEETLRVYLHFEQLLFLIQAPRSDCNGSREST
jgi:hypothetical protein